MRGASCDPERMSLGLLGLTVLYVPEGSLPVTSAKIRAFLASMSLADGGTVPLDDLVAALYPTNRPQNVLNAVHQLVLRTRRLLEEAGHPGRVTRTQSGYAWNNVGAITDVQAWRAACQRASAAGAGGNHAQELRFLDEALDLWRGPALVDVHSDWLRQRYVPALTEQLRRARARRNDLALSLGLHAELIGPLTAHTSENPLDEVAWAQLVLSLLAEGRRSEALSTYGRARERIREDLGVAPGPRLQSAFQSALAETPSYSHSGLLRLHQLPGHRVRVIGRDTEVADAVATFTDVGERGRRMLVLSGMAGVGKTATALEVAHRLADRYPDGQLWLDLQASALSPMRSQQATTSLLRMLRPWGGFIPESHPDQVALLRSELASRQLLLVLDDAHSAEQVSSLLPGNGNSAVIVTSRTELLDLAVVHHAARIHLSPLPSESSMAVFKERLGDSPWLSDELRERIAAHAHGLPLALSVIAARLASGTTAHAAELCEHLASPSATLDVLSGAEERTNLRALFSWSVRGLSTNAHDAFLTLGLHPTGDLGHKVAADLLDAHERKASAVIQELTEHNILSAGPDGRLAVHPLMHRYAAERANDLLTSEERKERVQCLVNTYRRTCDEGREHADSLMEPSGWVTPEKLAVIGVVHLAIAEGLSEAAWQLAGVAATDLVQSADWYSLHDIVSACLQVGARHPVDGMSKAHAHQLLGRALRHQGRPREAAQHLEAAVEAARCGEDSWTETRALAGLSALAEDRDDWESALFYDNLVLSLVRHHGHVRLEAEARNHVAWDLAHLNRLADAARECREALVIASADGNLRIEAAIWDTLGRIMQHSGDLELALGSYEIALAQRRDLQHQVGLGGTEIHVAEVLWELGRTEEATKHRDRGLDRLEEWSPGRARLERGRLKHDYRSV